MGLKDFSGKNRPENKLESSSGNNGLDGNKKEDFPEVVSDDNIDSNSSFTDIEFKMAEETTDN